MKSLRESILDDEDVLMDKVKRFANDPFLLLKTFKGRDLMKCEDEIISVLKVFPLPKLLNYLKNVNYTYDIADQNKKIYIRNGDNKKDLSNVVCEITMDPAHSLFDDDRDIIILHFDEDYHQSFYYVV